MELKSSPVSSNLTHIETVVNSSNKVEEHTCMIHMDVQKYQFEVNNKAIHNVFLINTVEEIESIALELENLFKKFDLNVYGIMKKKDATFHNIMNSVEEFRGIIQNN